MSLGRQKLAISAFFLFALILTVNRNIQWEIASAILVDAIRQNPDNSTLRINYAVVLEGDLALQQHETNFILLQNETRRINSSGEILH